MQNARLDEAQAGIKIAGRNINNLRYADGTTLMAESGGELKSLLMQVKEDSEKTGLKHNIQKAKITESHPITAWQTDGENVKIVSDFTFLGFRITVDDDCSHKIKEELGRRAMTNLDSVLKIGDTTADKVPYSQRYGFSRSHVWMWEVDHKQVWAPKNWYFQTVVLEKTLESPLDSKEIKLVTPKGNQPWKFIGMTDAEAEAPILWPPDEKSFY